MNIKALVCWIIVGIPLGWALYTSVQKAKPLFTSSISAPAKPADAPNK
jgi:hypothetical protein